MQGKDTDRIKHDSRSYEVQCAECGHWFEAARSDATFCSSKCRTHHARAPRRLQNTLDRLEQMKTELDQTANKYKHSHKVFQAMQSLAASLNDTLAIFEE